MSEIECGDGGLTAIVFGFGRNLFARVDIEGRQGVCAIQRLDLKAGLCGCLAAVWLATMHTLDLRIYISAKLPLSCPPFSLNSL